MKHVPQTPWTDEERAMLRRLRQNGLGATRIGLMMGRSKHSVDKQLRYLALNVPQAPGPASPKVPERPSHDAGGGIRAGKTTLPPLPSLAEGQDLVPE
jgi:hypothetical protein